MSGVEHGQGLPVYRMETGDFFRFEGRAPVDLPTTATVGRWFPTDDASLGVLRDKIAWIDMHHSGNAVQLADAVMRVLFGDAS